MNLRNSGSAAQSPDRPAWQASRWDVDHVGRPLGDDRVFVVAPPAEIGTLLSAWSSVRKGRRISSLWGRILICVMWTLGIWGAFELNIVLGQHFWHWSEDTALLIRGVGLSFAPCAGLLAFFQIDWNDYCTFVGNAGIAEYAFRRGKIRSKVLRFEDAIDFKGRETREYMGFYAGTRYVYAWINVSGRCLFRTKGYYRSKSGNPEAQSPYHFARAALRAWNAHTHARPPRAKGFPVLPAA